MRRRAKARSDKLLKLHMLEVPELEQALAQAGLEGFEPRVDGGEVLGVRHLAGNQYPHPGLYSVPMSTARTWSGGRLRESLATRG